MDSESASEPMLKARSMKTSVEDIQKLNAELEQINVLSNLKNQTQFNTPVHAVRAIKKGQQACVIALVVVVLAMVVVVPWWWLHVCVKMVCMCACMYT